MKCASFLYNIHEFLFNNEKIVGVDRNIQLVLKFTEIHCEGEFCVVPNSLLIECETNHIIYIHCLVYINTVGRYIHVQFFHNLMSR